MTLQKVTLTCDEGAGQGYFRGTGTGYFTPSAVLTDATDHLIVDLTPIPVIFGGGTAPQVQLLATDNANLMPAGWGWTFTPPAGSGMTAFTFFLPFAAGASQYLSAQTPVSTAVTMQGYLPLPSGTAGSGQVPVATGSGSASAWGSVAGTTPAVDWLNVVTGYGAKGDGLSRADGAITSGLAVLTSASGTFTLADVGKLVNVTGAGAAGAPLVTTISGFTSSTTVTLAATAGTTVSAAQYSYGTANDTAFANAAAALPEPVQTTSIPGITGGGLYIPAGVYLFAATINWKLNGLKVTTDGFWATVLEQVTSNIPIVQVAGSGQSIGGLTLTYSAQQPSGSTSAICMEFGDDTVGSSFLGNFYDLVLQYGQTGMAINPAITVVAGLFSCLFSNIQVSRFSFSAINLNGNNGLGGAECTGCCFNNVYISNVLASGAQQSCSSFVVLLKNWSDVVFNQLNVEHCTVGSTDALGLSSVQNAVFNVVHFESISLPANGTALLHPSGIGSSVFNGVTVYACTYTGSSTNNVVNFFGTGVYVLTINGYNEKSCTVTTPSHPFINFGTATNCTAIISGLSATQATVNATTANAGDVALFGLPLMTSNNLSDLGNATTARINLGMSWKDPVQQAATGALPANTYSAGVLTATANGVLVVDGVTCVAGQRILVAGEATAQNNGIYAVTQPGSAGTPYILARSADMASGVQVTGATVMVEQGTAAAGSGWFLAGAGPDVIGTTALFWTKITQIISGSNPQPLGTAAPGTTGFVADIGHIHVMPRLDQVTAPTASVGMNSQKITSLLNGAGAQDGAAFGQIPVAEAALANIQPEGIASALGSSGKWPNSDHAHLTPLWLPADNGLLVASCDPGVAASSTGTVAGTLYLIKLQIRTAITITNVWWNCVTAGVGATSGSFTGLYNSAGTLLSGSADVGASFTSTGSKSLALTTPQALTAGTFVWGALLINLATTQPVLARSANTGQLSNTNLAAASFRAATNGTGLVALPGTVTPSSNLNGTAYWAGGS